MHRTHDPGTTNHTEGTPAANELFVQEPTAKYNTGIRRYPIRHLRDMLDMLDMFKPPGKLV